MNAVCKVAVKGVGNPDQAHVWTPGRGWPVGKETVVTVVDAEKDPPAPVELTTGKLGFVAHPTEIGRDTYAALSRHPSLQLRVIDGKEPAAPAPDALAGAIARAEIAEAKVKESDALLAAAAATNAEHVKARDGMSEKIRRLETQLHGGARG